MKKPRLHFWQIWNMSFGFLGIQFGFALQKSAEFLRHWEQRSMIFPFCGLQHLLQV
jgi:hypothetical protein